METNKLFVLIAAALVSLACTEFINETPVPGDGTDKPWNGGGQAGSPMLSLPEIAEVFSCLPMRQDQLNEVYEAVSSSSGNGYDEEYMLSDLFLAPGCGVGTKASDKATKAIQYRTPLRDMFRDYIADNYATKSGSADVEAYINSLIQSDIQIYWPYSEDWDGKSYPIVTFDPGYGAESNYGYEIRFDETGARVVDYVFVDEKIASERPVWVINTNDDSAFTPLDMFLNEPSTKASSDPSSEGGKVLYLEDITALRNYDSWFGGASEFFIKCGSGSGFKAKTDEELKLFYPEINDFMVVVKRKYIGTKIPLDAILVSDYTSQIEKIVFMMIEDDGGTTTEWKANATVKYKSKSYGFEISLPYKEKDDIVWRGQLSSNFFKDQRVTGRLGDVIITFRLE